MILQLQLFKVDFQHLHTWSHRVFKAQTAGCRASAPSFCKQKERCISLKGKWRGTMQVDGTVFAYDYQDSEKNSQSVIRCQLSTPHDFTTFRTSLRMPQKKTPLFLLMCRLWKKVRRFDHGFWKHPFSKDLTVCSQINTETKWQIAKEIAVTSTHGLFVADPLPFCRVSGPLKTADWALGMSLHRVTTDTGHKSQVLSIRASA